jgi:hypothetical protein
MQYWSVDGDSGLVLAAMHKQAEPAHTTSRNIVLSSNVAAVELQCFRQLCVPLQDLIVQEPNLVFLGILSGFVREVVIPYLGCNLVVFRDVLEIWVALVLCYGQPGNRRVLA